MAFLEVSDISKKQGNEPVVCDISFALQQNRKLAIAGETGSGKTTLLKLIAGYVQPDKGQIKLQGKRVEGPMEKLLPGHPDIAYLSQHFELRNNYRIEEELGYLNRVGTEEACVLYDLCEIKHLLKRKTDQVSGGEKQRISLARLLVSSPKLLLLDEPYSNLDIIHKNTLKKVIEDISEKLNITCVMISHDPNDLLSWADEIIVMKEGTIVQQGTPDNIYNFAATKYVASLFGTCNEISNELYETLFATNNENETGRNFLIRPERFAINTPSNIFVEGTIAALRYYGFCVEADIILLNGEKITVKTEDFSVANGSVCSRLKKELIKIPGINNGSLNRFITPIVKTIFLMFLMHLCKAPDALSTFVPLYFAMP